MLLDFVGVWAALPFFIECLEVEVRELLLSCPMSVRTIEEFLLFFTRVRDDEGCLLAFGVFLSGPSGFAMHDLEIRVRVLDDLDLLLGPFERIREGLAVPHRVRMEPEEIDLVRDKS